MFETISKIGEPIVGALAAAFESHPMLATYYTTAARWIFVGLALFIVFKAVISLLAAKNPSEIWAYLKMPDGSIRPLRHWENVLGRARSSDIVFKVMTVSRNHGTLIRDQRGNWRYNDLGSKGGSMINGHAVYKTTPVHMGDTISLAGAECILVPPSLKEKQENIVDRIRSTKRFLPWSSLIAITIFQVLTCVQLIAAEGSDLPFSVLLAFAVLTATMWIYCAFLRVLRSTSFEMEAIAFFLCTLGLAVVATSAPESTMKQMLTILIGIGLYTLMCFYLRNLNRGVKLRKPLLVISVGLFIFNVVFGKALNGATIWVTLGGYSMQPSELVKIAFIFIGSATLDELYEKRNLQVFLFFSLFCFGCLAVMNDFGTALIFFVTFLVISFLRSGEFTKLVTIVSVCAVAGLLAIRFVPHIASRFATWGHIWEYTNEGGYQQVRALSAGASGGMLGLGAGNGFLKNVFASNTDMVFCYIQEEWGLIIAILAVLAIITLGIFAVRSITAGRSTFYTIAACSATSLLIFQSALNVLGTIDILPFTGVTLPFISNGGTSMIASWGLLSFLKAADTRQGASIAVKDAGDGAEDMYLEDYIAEVDGEDYMEDLERRERERVERMEEAARSQAPRPRQKQGDVEVTDFSQLEDDDL